MNQKAKDFMLSEMENFGKKIGELEHELVKKLGVTGGIIALDSYLNLLMDACENLKKNGFQIDTPTESFINHIKKNQIIKPPSQLRGN